jgi:hypothetical protein
MSVYCTKWFLIYFYETFFFQILKFRITQAMQCLLMTVFDKLEDITI